MANRETDMAIKRQGFLDAAFTLFAEKGIEAVSLESVAQASGFGIATLYRHFFNKVTLVVELAAQKWEEYIQCYNSTVSRERIEEMTGAEYLKFYLDSFLDLYRHHKDILRFNYDLNSFLRKERHENGQMERYMTIVDQLGADGRREWSVLAPGHRLVCRRAGGRDRYASGALRHAESGAGPYREAAV